MKTICISFFVFFCTLCSTSISAYEGPYLSDGVPHVRVSQDGDLTVFGLPVDANCHKNKANLLTSYYEDVSSMVLSVVLAAQTSGKNVNIWIDRYLTFGGVERCSISFIEMVN